MYKFNPHDINNPFLTRPGEQIVDLDRYVDVLKENNIPFSVYTIIIIYKIAKIGYNQIVK
ncbi:hypothetical protein [Clostridium saudiense]|uniref:hypothetical protein n=1 Tax=Clostridium saudiense TaxID=1414720 RepID=UPI0008202F46|nr:hypothetical protein [Clostridium saudiense]MDU3521527.1 hypothetical protein [Clostridium saudiense]SCJ45448.1 Uncharacterised protein [uncultured Clostridium sp.]